MKTFKQYGISNSADFEEMTWTFDMEEGYKVRSGEFAILLRSDFEKMESDNEKMIEMLQFIKGYGAKCDWNKLEQDIEKLIQ